MASSAPSSTSYRWLKRLFLAVLCIMLVLPAIQAKFHFAKMPGLGGYSEPAPHPALSSAALLDNSYQPALEKYLEDRIGFREWLIRLRNQVAYSAFNMGRANNTVIGGNDIMFDGNAINSYLGKDFVGEEEVNRNVRRLKDVQDTLASHGTLLVFVIAPAKSAIYPKLLPAYYQKQPRSRSTYTAYSEKMTAAGINLVDFGKLFRVWKDTSAYPLFPRGGIHWSLWGRDLAVDTLFNYIRQRGHFTIPDCRITSPEFSKEPRDTDNDIAKALNLLREPEAFLMAYSHLEFDPLKPGQQKPNLLLVGDSFAWSLIPYVPAAFNEQTRFWYYNEVVDWPGPEHTPEGRRVGDLDKKAQLKGRDVVILLYTEPNLIHFDHGFTNSLYQAYHPWSEADNARFMAFKRKMLQDTATANRLWKQGYTLNVDPNNILYNEARAIFEKDR